MRERDERCEMREKVREKRDSQRSLAMTSQNLTRCAWKILEGSFAMQQGELQVLPGRIHWARDAYYFSVVRHDKD